MAVKISENANIYLYDPITANWRECDTASNSPAVIVAEVFWGKNEGAYSKPSGHYAHFMNPNYHSFDWSYFHATTHQRLVWCPRHRRFEKIHHLERMDSIRSVNGCRIQGNVSHFTVKINISDRSSMRKNIATPIRWELKQMSDGSVSIKGEILSLTVNANFEEYAISLANDNLESCKITIGENFHIGERDINFSPTGKDWTEFNLDIPAVITEQATAYLLQAADCDAYIPPDSNTDGYRKLRAFARRPQDLHIEYWREIIGDEFDALFPRNQKNTFLALCEYLNLKPTAGLTEGYEQNPFAPLWAALLKGWGFKEEESIANFYGIKEFAGILPEQFEIIEDSNGKKVNFKRYFEIVMINHATGEVSYSDGNDGKNAWNCPEVQGYLAENILSDRFDLISSYAEWGLSETSEEHLAKGGLFPLVTKPWTNEVYEELRGINYLNDDSYICSKEKTLSRTVKHHLLRYDKDWGGHWRREHELTVKELEKIEELWGEREEETTAARFESNDVPEEQPQTKPDLSRTIRLLRIYDKLLSGKAICVGDYGNLTMFGRDMRFLRRVESTISYRPRDGKYKILNNEKKYAEDKDIGPLADKSRKVRLLTYVRLLRDFGYLSRDIVKKIMGRAMPRRTFVRDVNILRRAFPKRELIYNAHDKRYMWKEGKDNESY